MRRPADPPTVEELVAVMRHARDDRHGWRVRAMIVVLWRAGLRIQEALALSEHDLDHRRGSVLIRNGEGGRGAYQLRHAHALELAREGVPLNIIQRQLGHATSAPPRSTSQGIDPEELIATVHMRRAPMMSASAGLRL
jgi:site-specific recombinase XerD